jgi:uncharacterized membrane protein YkoI
MRKFIRGLWAVTVAMAFSVPAARAAEEKVPLDKLPKPVTAAVKAKFPDAELKGAEKEEADGKTIYEVSLKSKGSDYDVSLTPEGQIIEIEKTIAAKDLPAAVVKGLDQKYPKATIKLAEEISKDNKTNYEVIIETADKKKLEVVLDPTGKILKEEDKSKDDEAAEGEEEIPLDKLPKVVVDAVKAKFPGAELQSAAKEDEDGTLVYEVVIKHKGHTIEVILSLAGKITASEKAIEAKDLPAKVSKALAETYPKATIKKTEELTKNDKISYEVILETADKKALEVVFDPEGKVIDEEAKDEKEE